MRTSAKKGSLQLSVNAIVVLVLAITMLGIGISFTRSLFNDVKFDTTVDLPNPTSQNPISIPSSELDFSLTGKTKTNIKVYNAGSTTLYDNNIPIIVCKGRDSDNNPFQSVVEPLASGSKLQPGDVGEYRLIVDGNDFDNTKMVSGESYSCKYLVCENEDNNDPESINGCYNDGTLITEVDGKNIIVASKPFILNARSG